MKAIKWIAVSFNLGLVVYALIVIIGHGQGSTIWVLTFFIGPPLIIFYLLATSPKFGEETLLALWIRVKKADLQKRLCIIAVLVDAVRNALITANKRGKSNPLLTGFGRHVTLATEKYHMGDP